MVHALQGPTVVVSLETLRSWQETLTRGVVHEFITGTVYVSRDGRVTVNGRRAVTED